MGWWKRSRVIPLKRIEWTSPAVLRGNGDIDNPNKLSFSLSHSDRNLEMTQQFQDITTREKWSWSSGEDIIDRYCNHCMINLNRQEHFVVLWEILKYILRRGQLQMLFGTAYTCYFSNTKKTNEMTMKWIGLILS